MEREEMTAREAKEVVIEARRRHTGLREEYLDLHDAGRPNAGTVHGRLRLMGQLSADQFSAAEWVIGKREAYLRAIQAPERGAIFEAKGAAADDTKYAQWCRDQREKWTGILTCIAEASVSMRSPLLSAIDVLLFRQQLVEHMVGDLRCGLNAVFNSFISARKHAA